VASLHERGSEIVEEAARRRDVRRIKLVEEQDPQWGGVCYRAWLETPLPVPPISPLRLDTAEPGPAAPPSDDPPIRVLIAMGAFAIALRVVFAAATMVATGLSLSDCANLRDGPSFIRIAAALQGEGQGLVSFDRRVFLGYPFAMAALGSMGLSLPAAGLLLSWVGTGVAAAASGALFRSRSVGWATAALLPSHVMYSSLVMSEALLLALCAGGLLAAERGRSVLGGVLLGCATVVRPVAVFAMLGYALASWRWPASRRAPVVLGVGVLVATIGYVFASQWSGDALVNVRQYNRVFHGRVFGWPFEALIFTPLQRPIPAWKMMYVYAHAALVVSGCALLGRALRRGGSTIDWLAGGWLIGNTVFALCVGKFGGFQEFHRYILPALPALFWAHRGLLPRTSTGWATCIAVSVALAGFGVIRRPALKPHPPRPVRQALAAVADGTSPLSPMTSSAAQRHPPAARTTTGACSRPSPPVPQRLRPART
jgi:hypothetical protein